VRVDASHRSWQVSDGDGLRAVLAWRDKRGGAQFWLSEELEKYPVLAITVTSEVAHVIYFPREGHAGFRCLGGQGLPKDGSTTFFFDRCDPATGEEAPNEFVVPLETARSIAAEFLRTKQMSEVVSWLEL
jgi:hypothetical protein